MQCFSFSSLTFPQCLSTSPHSPQLHCCTIFANRAKSDKIWIFALKAPFTSNKYFERKNIIDDWARKGRNELKSEPKQKQKCLCLSKRNLLNCILNSAEQCELMALGKYCDHMHAICTGKMQCKFANAFRHRPANRISRTHAHSP